MELASRVICCVTVVFFTPPPRPQPGGLESDLPSVKKEMQVWLFFCDGARQVGLEEASSSSPGDANHAGNLPSPTSPSSSSVVLSVFVWVFHTLWRGGAFISQCVDLSRCPERVAGGRRKTEETDRCCFEPVFCQEIQFLFDSFWGDFFLSLGIRLILCVQAQTKCACCGEC